MNGRRQAVILAAGQGKRLQPLTNETPKTLLDVGGCAILEHILQALEANGYERVIVVTGFESDRIESYCQSRNSLKIEFVHSERFASTNNIYSLWLTREYLEDGFTLINSDTLFSPSSLAALQRIDGSGLLVDAGTEQTSEEMLVAFEDEGIETIGKSIDDADGEYIGVAKFTAEDTKLLFDCIKWFIEQDEVNEWYEAAFDRLFEQATVQPVSVDNPWIEIDTHEDISIARRMWE